MIKENSLFKNFDGEFLIDCSRVRWNKPVTSSALTDSINKNKEVAGLLNLVKGDYCDFDRSRYSPRFIFGVLCLTKTLLINQLGLSFKCNKGVLRKEILNGIFNSEEIKRRLRKLPLDTTAKDVFDCLKKTCNFGFNFYNNTTIKYNLRQNYIDYDKLYRILSVFEKAGYECSVEIINNAIREIDEVLNIMINDTRLSDTGCFGNPTPITAYDYSDDIFNFKVKNREQVIKEVVEGGAMADNTQTLTLNRPKQQENKLLTVGNKKAYQVVKGDYQHRKGVIKEEKAEMSNVVPYKDYKIEDKAVLSDLEDLLNNVIDNPDTVDDLVNYLANNVAAAHFISEMVSCGEIDSEESLLEVLNRALDLVVLHKAENNHYNTLNLTAKEKQIFNYLNVEYPRPVFGKEFRTFYQYRDLLADALHNIEPIFDKAKAEEEAEEEQEEEKEEVITHDAVQEHAGEDCEEYPADLEELQKLLEERRKKEAELDAEIKQAEEEARRKELVEQLLAADNRIKEKEERLAQLRKK